MVELEGLQFEIQGSSDEATKSIDAFIKTLDRLKRVTATGTTGLSKTSESLKKLNRVLNTFDNKKLTRITNALERLGSVKGVTLSPTLSKRIDDLATSIKHITHDDISKLNDLTEALKDLGSVGDVRIPNIKQKKEKKRAEETEIPESTGKSITNLAKVMQSLAEATSKAIVPLNQLASIGIEIYQSFEQMVEGTWRYVNVVGLLESNTTKAIVPLTQLAHMGMGVYEAFEQMVEGVWRYIHVAGELESSTIRAIVPFQQMNLALADTQSKAVEFSNVIEGTWSSVSDGTQVTSSFASSSNRLKEVFVAIRKKLEEFGESVKKVVGSIKETFLEIAECLKPAIVAIEYLIKIIAALLSRLFDAFKKLLGVIWRVLTPLRQLIVELMKLPAIGLQKIGKMLIAPFDSFINKIKNARKTFDNLLKSIARIAVYRLIRSVLKELSQGFRDGINNLYQYSKLINGDFAKSLDSLTTNLQYLKNSLGAMVSPIINALAPAFDILTQKIVGVINAVNQLISRLTGKSTYLAAKKLVKAYQEIKNATIGIDELNIIGDDVDDYANMFEELPITDEIKSFADKLKEAFESADWEGIGKLLGDKVNEAVDKIPWDEIGEKIGYWLNAAIQTAYYFLDTVDFANLGGHLAGMINNVIENIDFEVFGRLFVKKLTVIWDLVIGFLENLDWGLVGKSLTNFVVGTFNEFVEWFEKWNWADLGETFTRKVNDFLSNLDAEEIGRKIGSFLKTLFRSFSEWIDNVDWVQVSKDLYAAISDFFKGFDFDGVVKEFFSFVSSAASAMEELLRPVWENIVKWWNDHVKGKNFKESLENLVKYLLKFVNENILTPFMKAFLGDSMKEDESAFDKFKEVGKKIIEGVKKGIDDWIAKHCLEWVIKNIFGPYVWSLCQAFGIASPAKEMIPYGEDIIMGLFEGISKWMENIKQWVKENIYDPVIEGFKELYKDIKEIASFIWGWITEGFRDISESVKEISGTLWGWIKEGFDLMKETVKSIAGTLWGWIKEGFYFIVDKVKDVGRTVVGWFKDGTEDKTSESVAKETGASVVDNIQEGAESKISDFDEVGRKIAECIYDSLSEAKNDNQLSLLEELAGNIVSNLIESMKRSLAEGWEGYDMAGVLQDFAHTFTSEIFESLTTISDNEEMTLLDALSANIVSTIINGMKNSLVSDLKGYDMVHEMRDFSKTFTDMIFECLSTTDENEELSLLDALSANIVSTMIRGMGRTLIDELAGYDIKGMIGDFSGLFTDLIFDSLATSVNGNEEKSLLEDLAEKIVSTLLELMKDKLKDVQSGLMDLAHDFARDFIDMIYSALTQVQPEGGMSVLDAFSESIVNDITKGMTKALDFGANSVGGKTSDVKSGMQNFAEAFADCIYEALTGIDFASGENKSVLDRLSENISKTLIKNIKNDLEDALTQMESDLDDKLQDMVQNAHDIIDSIETDITITIHEVHVVEYEYAHATGGIVAHASGGIFNKPTVANIKGQTHLFGEAGREAVLPLDSYTGWMDQIAEKVVDASDTDAISHVLKKILHTDENFIEVLTGEFKGLLTYLKASNEMEQADTFELVRMMSDSLQQMVNIFVETMMYLSVAVTTAFETFLGELINRSTKDVVTSMVDMFEILIPKVNDIMAWLISINGTIVSYVGQMQAESAGEWLPTIFAQIMKGYTAPKMIMTKIDKEQSEAIENMFKDKSTPLNYLWGNNELSFYEHPYFTDNRDEWMTDVVDKLNEQSDSEEEMVFGRALEQFYATHLEPVMAQINANTQRSADKDMTVRIGNRDIQNAYNNQTKADGYSFTGGR